MIFYFKLFLILTSKFCTAFVDALNLIPLILACFYPNLSGFPIVPIVAVISHRSYLYPYISVAQLALIICGFYPLSCSITHTTWYCMEDETQPNIKDHCAALTDILTELHCLINSTFNCPLIHLSTISSTNLYVYTVHPFYTTGSCQLHFTGRK